MWMKRPTSRVGSAALKAGVTTIVASVGSWVLLLLLEDTSSGEHEPLTPTSQEVLVTVLGAPALLFAIAFAVLVFLPRKD